MPTNTPSDYPVTVPLSYIAALLEGDIVGRRSDRDSTLIWWGVNETGTPQYRGRELTYDEAYAHGFVTRLLEMFDAASADLLQS